jgi:NitT/TauT family transport system permease protein
MKRAAHGVTRHSVSILTVAGFLAFWQLAGTIFGVPNWLLPSPVAIWGSFVEHSHLLQKHIIMTATEAVSGLALGSFVGILLATIMVHSPILERILMPLLVMDQSIPKLALAPLFVIWFGAGIKSKILIAMTISFFPLIVNAARGLTAIDPRLAALMRTLAASNWQVFTKVRAPNAVPYIFAGLKVAIPLSVIGAVIGEFIQANSGLGFIVLIAITEVDTPEVFVAILLMTLLSLVLFGMLSILEGLVLRWRYAHLVG